MGADSKTLAGLRLQAGAQAQDVERILGIIANARAEILRLDADIAAEEERTGVNNPSSPTYSTKAADFRRRRNNLERTTAFLEVNDLARAKAEHSRVIGLIESALRMEQRRARRPAEAATQA